MHRFLPSLMALAFVAALGTGTGVAADKMTGGSMGNMSMGTKCPKGQSWVKGHLDKKTGKMTKGYCRKKADKADKM